MNDFLKDRGYEPLPGQEGTIKDLRSIRRMNVALETNVEAARSYGQWIRQQGALAAFPATRFKRGRDAKVPRDWVARWDSARAATAEAGSTEATSEDDMVALANHPLWTDPEFNRLGSPWPPFDFQSGMMTTPVSRAEAMRLGLLPEKGDQSEEAGFLREINQPQDRSFNETLQARPAIAAQPIRDALADRLQGFAKWQDDTLIFTDPNGTRPGTEDEIAEVITSPLPIDPATGEAFRQMQAEAIAALIDEPRRFLKKTDRDLYHDLARLVMRTMPREQGGLFLRTITLDTPRGTEPAWLRPLTRSALWREALNTVEAAPRIVAVIRAIKALF
jgi:hypothetical protein